MAFLVPDVLTNLTVTAIDSTTSLVSFEIPMALTSYTDDNRNIFPAMLNALNASINGLSPKPVSILVNKAVNVVNQGSTSQVREIYTVTVVRQAVPGNFIVDP